MVGPPVVHLCCASILFYNVLRRGGAEKKRVPALAKRLLSLRCCTPSACRTNSAHGSNIPEPFGPHSGEVLSSAQPVHAAAQVALHPASLLHPLLAYQFASPYIVGLEKVRLAQRTATLC